MESNCADQKTKGYKQMSIKNVSNNDILDFINADPFLLQTLQAKVVAKKEEEQQKEANYILDLKKRELNSAICKSNNLKDLIEYLDSNDIKYKNYNVSDLMLETNLVVLANAILFVKNAKALPTAKEVITVAKEEFYSGQNLSPLVSQQQKPTEPEIECIPGYTQNELMVLHIIRNARSPITIREIVYQIPMEQLEARLIYKTKVYSAQAKMKLFVQNTALSIKALLRGKLISRVLSDHTKRHCYEYIATKK